MIVLSYRRADSPGFARALRERLVRELGAGGVFLDVETIEAGADFRQRLRAAVISADALVVVIGPDWLARAEGVPNRLHEPDDAVRLEIATALEHGVRVLPVLVDGAAMPAADALPSDIRPLADRNAIVLANERFESDVQRLLDALGGGAARRTRRRTIALAAMVVIAAAVIVGVIASQRVAAAPFALTVHVRESSSGVPVARGELVLRAGADVWTRTVDVNGEARFDDVPASVRDAAVTLSPRVAGYDTTSRSVRITEPIVTLRLDPSPDPAVVVRGVVLDANGRGAAAVVLDFDAGLATATSDSAGHFTVTIPRMAGSRVRLRATRDQEVGYHDDVTLPSSTLLVVRFRPGG